MISPLAVVGGAAAGLALGLLVRELLPARADLGDALRRMDATRPPAAAPGAGEAGLAEWVGSRLLGPLDSLVRLPKRDLELLRISPARHLGEKALWVVWALLTPQVLQVLVSVAGVRLPFVIPAVISLGLAVVMWVHPTVEVKRRAAESRLEFRHAIASYLERVDLARAASQGASQALIRTAEVGDGWTFARLRTALEQAQLAGVTAWEALRRLAEDLGVPELARPAETLALAGEDGATVRNTLQHQARQLRAAILADAKAEANAASESMIVPVIGLVVVMTIFAMYPAAVQIMSS